MLTLVTEVRLSCFKPVCSLNKDTCPNWLHTWADNKRLLFYVIVLGGCSLCSSNWLIQYTNSLLKRNVWEHPIDTVAPHMLEKSLKYNLYITRHFHSILLIHWSRLSGRQRRDYGSTLWVTRKWRPSQAEWPDDVRQLKPGLKTGLSYTLIPKYSITPCSWWEPRVHQSVHHEVSFAGEHKYKICTPCRRNQMWTAPQRSLIQPAPLIVG
jgi:hypothetical protein